MENIYARGPQNTLLSCFAKTSKGHLSRFYAKNYTLYERLINCLTFWLSDLFLLLGFYFMCVFFGVINN